MKITDLTENDVIHIRNKKEAKGIKVLLQNKGIGYWQNDLKLNIERVLGSGCISVYDGSFTYLLSGQEEGKNIIPASKFLKPSLKKRVKGLEKEVKEIRNQLNNTYVDAIEILAKPSSDIEVHFDEVEKLPEKWCVKANNDNEAELLTEWVKNNKQTDFTYKRDELQSNYFHYPNHGGIHTASGIIKGYTEISFETFKRIVWKEDENKSFEGKWIKKVGAPNFIMYVIRHEFNSFLGFGIDSAGNWFEDDPNKDVYQRVKNEGALEVTDEEVKTALISDEAERRGFKEGVIIKSIAYEGSKSTLKHYGETFLKDDMFYFKGCCVMKDGKWAEIISEPENDFSKAGQLVISTDEDKVLILTLPHKRDVEGTFTGIVLSSNGAESKGDISDDWATEDFTLYKDELTLSN